MPVIKSLPSPEIIRGLRGVLDFYVWRGLNCVRKWPRTPPSHRTAKSIAAAALFGAVVQGYALLGGALKTLFAEDAADQPRTGRDLHVAATLGHLHEVNLDEIIALLEQQLAILEILADLANALNDVGADELRVLPGYDGGAWQPILLDASRRLQVRGQDQLFSFKETYSELVQDLDATAGINELDTSPVDPGEIWVITAAGCKNTLHVCTNLSIGHSLPGGIARINSKIPTHVHDVCPLDNIVFLSEGHYMQARFHGCTLNDNLYFNVSGYKMTLET